MCLFESRRHNDLEVGLHALAGTVDLLLIRLTENLETWTDFSGIKNLNLETVQLLFHL